MPPLLSCAGDAPAASPRASRSSPEASMATVGSGPGYGEWTPGDSAAERVRRCLLVKPRRTGSSSTHQPDGGVMRETPLGVEPPSDSFWPAQRGVAVVV